MITNENVIIYFMNKKKIIKCIALVAREHGMATLKEILEIDGYDIMAIFTHKLNPKVYDVDQKIRNDFIQYEEFAKKNNIPLYTIDSKFGKKVLDSYISENEFEFLISISWRYLIPKSVFEKAKYGAINLHRGDLPKYAGIEPIKRALENNEKEIAVCCHHITSNFDEGKVIFKDYHKTNYQNELSLEQNVVRLKKEITKYFPKLTIKTLEYLMETSENES
jgi:methionyl-tRNA formyltransferase